jgi:proteasome lid subunit RPN8/RPN11
MLIQCQQEAPAEACGLLGGADGLSGTRMFPLENLDACAESYRMDTKEVLSVMRQLDEDGMELNAIYHSHPATPARPSKVDIAQAYMPVLYVILSLCGEAPVLRGYYISDGDVTEIPVEIVETAGEALVE